MHQASHTTCHSVPDGGPSSTEKCFQRRAMHASLAFMDKKAWRGQQPASSAASEMPKYKAASSSTKQTCFQPALNNRTQRHQTPANNPAWQLVPTFVPRFHSELGPETLGQDPRPQHLSLNITRQLAQHDMQLPARCAQSRLMHVRGLEDMHAPCPQLCHAQLAGICQQLHHQHK